jgi:agmatinase
MRRIFEMDVPIVQAGIRAVCKEDVDFISSKAIESHSAKKLCAENIQQIELAKGLPNDVYITIDVDGLDPSVIPATGTPVPGGLGWYQTLNILESVVRQKNVIGFDVVELAPGKDDRVSAFTAARLVYEVMGMIARKIIKPQPRTIPSEIPKKKSGSKASPSPLKKKKT